MVTRSLPPRPSLEHLKKQAKDLLKAHKSGDSEVCLRIRRSLSRLSNASDSEILRAKISLVEAQHVIAREYGFVDWATLKSHVQANMLSRIQRFHRAVRNGELAQVNELLQEDPSLVNSTTDDPHWPTPLHVAAAKGRYPQRVCKQSGGVPSL